MCVPVVLVFKGVTLLFTRLFFHLANYVLVLSRCSFKMFIVRLIRQVIMVAICFDLSALCDLASATILEFIF